MASLLEQTELIETRRIATLRFDVEWCIERIKNFHFFDGVMLVGVADQIFFVRAQLTNFQKPLRSVEKISSWEASSLAFAVAGPGGFHWFQLIPPFGLAMYTRSVSMGCS